MEFGPYDRGRNEIAGLSWIPWFLVLGMLPLPVVWFIVGSATCPILTGIIVALVWCRLLVKKARAQK